jgi:hypothetical protein
MARVHWRAGLAFSVLVAACGIGSWDSDGSKCPGDTPPPPANDCSSSITSVTLAAAADTIAVGRGAPLAGRITAPTSYNCYYTTRLSSSDTTIAGLWNTLVTWGAYSYVSGTSQALGAVVGRAPGTAIITHVGATDSATISITVIPAKDAFVAVSTGGADVCALGAEGKSFCWSPSPTVPLVLSDVPPLASVDAGPSLDCGITLGKQAYCWTLAGIYWATSPPAQVELPADALMVDAGGTNHACALTTAHAAYCWGSNTTGQVGTPGDYGWPAGGGVPLTVAGGLQFQKVTAGGDHTCGLGDDGSLWCWGSNASGELGLNAVPGCNGFASCQPSPARVRLATDSVFSDVATGYDHTCALTAAGEAYCWGRNSWGQLGTADTASGSTPRKVAGSHTFVSLSAGTGYTCGLTAAGDAYCWGTNESGQLGSGTANGTCGQWSGPCETTPVLVSGGHTFSSLSAGNGMTCGTTGSGAWCWGRSWGPDNTFSNVPVRVPGQL